MINMNLRDFFSALCDNKPCGSGDDFFNLNDDVSCRYESTDIEFVTSYFSNGFNRCLLDASMNVFFNISFNAFDILLHAWLSELPVEKEILSFGGKIFDACRNLPNQEDKQRTANRIITDRTDSDTRIVLNAAGKTGHEVHRMMGLLRFSPDQKGVFSAECEPDHFILPCLGMYFTSRFGKSAWSVTDKKRSLSLSRTPGKKAKISILHAKTFSCEENKTDDWEELWKHYHKTINNEDRNNPGLQRQLMPKRYWKYLPEK